MKKDQYVIISNHTPETENVGDAMREIMAVANTFSKAYNVGLTIGRISTPDIKYRKSLELIKLNNCVAVTQVDGENSFTISKIKYY